ncbi:MAG TPA: SDR family NAD(P)-dependent oxidoreductase [Silvibacterium sp.]|nr:SDR family NAD(P)-dependent oxidoreductase [Silvibacterium sp.]
MGDKLALVTGASSGIGFSLAKEFAGRGYDLVICSEGDRLDSAAQKLAAMGANVVEVRADLATEDGVQDLWDKFESLNRMLDIACINAGIGVGGLFGETDLAAELQLVRLNCVGTVQLASLWCATCKIRAQVVSYLPRQSLVRWLLPAKPSTPPVRHSYYRLRTL